MSSQMEQRETQCTMSQHNGNPNLLFGKLDPSHSRDMPKSNLGAQSSEDPKCPSMQSKLEAA
jgi:hypothetical protein